METYEAKLNRCVRGYLRDLVTDIRCADRVNQPDYKEQCRTELARLYSQRHSLVLGKYGVPEINP